jgi:hypothetical protein
VSIPFPNRTIACVLTTFLTQRNPEGVVAIKFVEPESAVKCASFVPYLISFLGLTFLLFLLIFRTGVWRR